MTAKATGLCAKSRRAVDGGVSRVKKKSKFWNCAHAPTTNARKRGHTERNAAIHARKHFFSRIGTKLGRKWPKSPFAA